MAATSATGKGKGAAFPGQTGPGNNRNLYKPLTEAITTPHLVMTDEVTLSGGTKTVTFSTALPGGYAHYTIMLTAVSATTTLPRVTTRTDSSGTWVSFVITGNGTDVIDYAIFTKGSL